MVLRNDQFNPALRNLRNARLIEVMARLRPGVTVEQAQADMAAIARNLQTEYPETNADVGVRVVPALEQVTGRVAIVLWVLLGAVGCVLAIACANVANALMAGAVRRRPELSLRVSLGARRWHIVRQLALEGRLAVSLAQDRFSAWVLGLFAVVAVALAVGGLYAVLSYAVEQRFQEFGVRVALGAMGRVVVGLVLRDGLRTMGVGIATGVAAGLALSRVLERLLFDVSATDPLTFAVAALVLGIAGLLACWIPVRRATAVDPIIVLR